MLGTRIRSARVNPIDEGVHVAEPTESAVAAIAVDLRRRSADASVLRRWILRLNVARVYCEEILECLTEFLQSGGAMRSGR